MAKDHAFKKERKGAKFDIIDVNRLDPIPIRGTCCGYNITSYTVEKSRPGRLR